MELLRQRPISNVDQHHMKVKLASAFAAGFLAAVILGLLTPLSSKSAAREVGLPTQTSTECGNRYSAQPSAVRLATVSKRSEER
jgi:hypothetical protein